MNLVHQFQGLATWPLDFLELAGWNCLAPKHFALAVNLGLILASVLNQQLDFVQFDFSEMLATAMSDPAIPAIVDFSAVFSEAYASHRTSAGLVETLMPSISRSTWLLITSNSLVGATESTTLTMVLERAIPLGVAIALDVAWQPNSWGLEPGSKPTPEVLRRIHPLAQEASLIRCTPAEDDAFFSAHDPLTIHRSLSQCPGVVITGIDGSVGWCIGGRIGTLETQMLNKQAHFFSALIKSFAEHPELLGNAGEGPGSDAVADPDELMDALFAAATK
jgi:hypothetical protein